MTGARLATFAVPGPSVARAALAADTAFFGYGVNGAGGVRAYSLCGNGAIDPGEQCDDGNGADGDCCTAECQVPATCDDGDACTSGDVCGNGVCAGTLTTRAELDCSLDGIASATCGDEVIPSSLDRAFDAAIARIQALATKAAKAAQEAKTPKVAKLRRAMLRVLDGVSKKIAKAARSRKPSRKISEGCQATLDGIVAKRRTVVEGFVF
jgi:cysteine-rich repeat protein